MIIKIHGSMGCSFVVSAHKPEAMLGKEERDKEAEALAYALLCNLPGNTIDRLVKHLGYLRLAVDNDEKERFRQKLKKSAKECEV